MNKNIKRMFFVLTLVTLLATLGAVCAANDANTTTAVDNSVSDVATVSDSASDTVATEHVQTTSNDNKIDTKTIIKDDKNLKTDIKTYIVNNDNVDDIFAGENYTLNDNINDGDILDFQGSITKNHSIIFNKAVNVTTSTHDAYISLNTTAGNLFGSEPGNSFIVNSGASYSNFTGLYLYNTQFWVTNANHIVFDNMSMVVSDKMVGSGVGQTSIRQNSSYITLKNSYIYTKNNGGSSSLVLAYANYCTLDNNTIVGEGTVGNLIYLTTYNVNIPKDQLANCHNNITNNRVIGPSNRQSTCYALAITGFDNLVENNTFSYVGAGLMQQWGSGTSVWEDPGVPTFYNKIINNTFNLGCGIDGQFKNVSFINNTINDNGKMNIYANTTLINNKVNGNLSIYTPLNLTNENLHNVIFNVNSSNSNLTNSNITGVILINNGANITIVNNTINNNENYTINAKTSGNTIINNTLIARTTAGESTVIMTSNNTLENNTPEPATDVILTDENYYTYFNEDSTVKTDKVQNFSTIYLTGEFYNKNFTFNNIITNLFNNQSTLYNTTILINEDTKLTINNITINNQQTTSPALIINSQNNVIQNTKINQQTDDEESIILINNDSNTLSNNIINMTSTTSTGKTNILKISSNKNTINNNNFNISTNNYINAILINSQDKTADNNIILSNTININTTANTNTIIIGENSNKNNISRNTLNIKSTNATAFTSNTTTSSNNVIERNNININTTDYASAIEINTNNNTNMEKITIYMNTIRINSNKTSVIIFNDPYKNIKSSNITNNNINVNANTITGLKITGNNIVLMSILTLTATQNNENNYGVIISNSENISMSGYITLTLTNTKGVILDNITNSNITLIRTTTPLIIKNSQNNLINRNTLNTTEEHSIKLINSSNNIIYNNSLEAQYPTSGDIAVTYDENSHDNIIENNTPNRLLLTNDNYNEFFDENNTFIKENVNVISLASDIYNKNMIITQPIILNNPENYTIYNTTITTNVTTSTTPVTLDNLKINNNNTEYTFNLLSRTTISKCDVYQEGNKQTIIKTRNYLTLENNKLELIGNNNILLDNTIGYITLKYNNMTTSGDNVTIIKSTNSTQRNYYSYNNIKTNATNSITINIDNSNTNGFLYNNIEIYGENTIAIQYSNTSTTRDIQNNNITTNSNTTTVILDNTNIGFNSNKVLVNNTLNDTPIVLVTSTQGQVRFNYLESYNTAGDDAVETLGNKLRNTPTTTGYQSNIKIDSPDELSQYKKIEIDIMATDAFDRPINGTITATINGVTTTVENGTIKYTPTDTTNVTIEAKYQDPTGKYNTATITKTLTVTPATITVDQITVTVGQTTNITARITAGNETITDINKGKITFKVNGKTLKDANGKIIYAKVVNGTATIENYEVPQDWAKDGTTIQAVYSGSTQCDKLTSEKTNITVAKAVPTLTTEDITATAGDKITLKATITDNDKIINTGKIVFKINGKTVKDENGKVIYAKVVNNSVEFEYTLPESYKTGSYNITATFISADYDRLTDSKTLTMTN